MTRRLCCAVLGILTLTGSASAHHSYAAYDRDHPVTIEGELEQLLFVNPHVLLRIRTDDSTVYTCVWQGIPGVNRLGVTEATFKVGDHLIVSGAPARDPNVKELATLRGISRPTDHVSWGVAAPR
jgi:hypothetical protein